MAAVQATPAPPLPHPSYTIPRAPPTDRDGPLERAILSLGPSLAPAAAEQLRNLHRYRAPASEISYPSAKLAGVLVLLHVDEEGELKVTLTTRALTMRSHPGETALPGGRWEEGDGTVEGTALREASEEIGLPLVPASSLLHLTTLPAFSSRTLLVVIPSVYLLVSLPSSTKTLLNNLVPSPAEVAAIFHIPLLAFLRPSSTGPLELPPRRRGEKRTKKPVPPPSEDSVVSVEPAQFALSHSFEDLIWLNEKLYRLHAFSHDSLPSAVTGLTADIILAAALIARDGKVGLEGEVEGEVEEGSVKRWAVGQMGWSGIVKTAMELQGSKGLSDRRTSAQ